MISWIQPSTRHFFLRHGGLQIQDKREWIDFVTLDRLLTCLVKSGSAFLQRRKAVHDSDRAFYNLMGKKQELPFSNDRCFLPVRPCSPWARAIPAITISFALKHYAPQSRRFPLPDKHDKPLSAREAGVKQLR
jgi:hypothetical protein